MKCKAFWWACFFWFFCASTVSAAVRINEIAWMGSSTSSRGEWIELANSGNVPISLSGWHVEAMDGSPNIALSGVIGANGYYLIERTSDLTVPNVSADLVTTFGAGLSNEGETLVLKDGGGVTVDAVLGGTNWANVGGDNKTKHTAQRTSSGWITGSPTPRAKNVLPNPTVVATASVTGEPLRTSAPSKVVEKATTKTSVGSATGTVLWEHDTTDLGGGILFGQKAQWFFVFIGVALSILAGVIIVRSGKKEESPAADDYTIIGDIIEGADDE